VNITGSVDLVTGGNRGRGKAFVRALLDAGARIMYEGTRPPVESGDPRVQLPRLDIIHTSEIAAAGRSCQDVTICVNNASVGTGGPLLQTANDEGARRDMESNCLGTLAMCRAFAPILKQNGGGASLNMLSVVGWFVDLMRGSYSVSRAAQGAMINTIRIEVRAQGTPVVGVSAGFIVTDLSATVYVPKARPEDVAAGSPTHYCCAPSSPGAT
jgi:NAD(P)-dependent dehydrogenase (short-subunit alcohol dehydrogenase family)